MVIGLRRGRIQAAPSWGSIIRTMSLIPLGTLVNVATVLLGSSLGLLLHRAFPERFRQIQFQATGLFTLALGAQMALRTQNTLLLVFSLLLGGLLGEALQLEARLEGLGEKLRRKLSSSGGGVMPPSEASDSPSGGGFSRRTNRESATEVAATGGVLQHRFAEGLTTAFLIFCVGPMTLIGALDEGLRGDHSLLLAKALLDGFTSFALASTYGLGVLCSALPLFIFQYGISLIGALAGAGLNEVVVAQLTGTGGALMLGLGLNLLGATRLRVLNLLPALTFALLAVMWPG